MQSSLSQAVDPLKHPRREGQGSAELEDVCFAPLEELRLFVLNPEKVRVVLHSDQIQFLAKVQPGRQLYAQFERQGKHWKEERKKNKEGIDRKIHGCEARCLYVLPGDVEEGKSEISSDGMAHLRGEATENQDKYRITLDAEQCFYNVCNSSEAVKAGWGTISITLTGAHMDLSNVSSQRRWIRGQTFNYNVKEVHYKAGEPMHHLHGKALLDSRDTNLELRERMRKACIEVYLQPAGFED